MVVVGNSVSDTSKPTTRKATRGPSGVRFWPLPIAVRWAADANGTWSTLPMCSPSCSRFWEANTWDGSDWFGRLPATSLLTSLS